MANNNGTDCRLLDRWSNKAYCITRVWKLRCSEIILSLVSNGKKTFDCNQFLYIEFMASKTNLLKSEVTAFLILNQEMEDGIIQIIYHLYLKEKAMWVVELKLLVH